jgi:hypothetical protein
MVPAIPSTNRLRDRIWKKFLQMATKRDSLSADSTKFTASKNYANLQIPENRYGSLFSKMTRPGADTSKTKLFKNTEEKSC